MRCVGTKIQILDSKQPFEEKKIPRGSLSLGRSLFFLPAKDSGLGHVQLLGFSVEGLISGLFMDPLSLIKHLL